MASLLIFGRMTLDFSILKGACFQLATRVARFMGNDTYAQLAPRAFEWMESANLVVGHPTNQRPFKAFLSRWMASTSQFLPLTSETIIKLFKFNAPLAAT